MKRNCLCMVNVPTIKAMETENCRTTSTVRKVNPRVAPVPALLRAAAGLKPEITRAG
jgi:hypothetical protein